MANIKAEYGASGAITITLASLGSSSTLVAGRESTAIDNTSNKYIDYRIGGIITTGTSPTAGRIEVFVIAPRDDAFDYPDVFDGTDSAETVTSRNILLGVGKLAAVMVTDTTSNLAYPFDFSLRDVYRGLAAPRKFVLFVTHNTVAALNATGGNHDVQQYGVYATST